MFFFLREGDLMITEGNINFCIIFKFGWVGGKISDMVKIYFFDKYVRLGGFEGRRCWQYFKMFLYDLKGATKLYFTHYLCAVIILFSTGLYKPAFSTYSFGKLVFASFWAFLCFLPVMYWIWCYLHKLCNICMIII